MTLYLVIVLVRQFFKADFELLVLSDFHARFVFKWLAILQYIQTLTVLAQLLSRLSRSRPISTLLFLEFSFTLDSLAHVFGFQA